MSNPPFTQSPGDSICKGSIQTSPREYRWQRVHGRVVAFLGRGVTTAITYDEHGPQTIFVFCYGKVISCEILHGQRLDAVKESWKEMTGETWEEWMTERVE